MGRMWVIPWTGTVTNTGGNCDLWEVTPGDDVPVQIRGIRLGQTNREGDAQEASLRVTVNRLNATVTSGSGGSAGAPEDPQKHGQTASFAVEVNNTTIATTSGTTDILDEIGWNVRATPYETWYPDERFALRAQQTEILVVRLEDTVPVDTTFCGTLWVEEL